MTVRFRPVIIDKERLVSPRQSHRFYRCIESGKYSRVTSTGIRSCPHQTFPDQAMEHRKASGKHFFHPVSHFRIIIQEANEVLGVEKLEEVARRHTVLSK